MQLDGLVLMALVWDSSELIQHSLTGETDSQVDLLQVGFALL